MEYRRNVIKIVCFLFILALIPVQTKASEDEYIPLFLPNKIIVNFVHILPENTPKGLAAKYFKKILEERSNGKFFVRLFSDMAKKGYNDCRAIIAIKKNIIQLACPSFSKFSKIVPQIQIFDLPFLFTSGGHLHRFENSKYGQKILNLFQSKGIIGLAYWDNGFKCMFNNKRIIKKPTDMAGLRFRIMPSEVLKAQFKAVKAQPVVLPFSKVYNAIKSGQVDGFENTWSNFYSKKFYEVQKYATLSYHGYLGYVLITNQKFLDSLSPDLKKIFLDCVQLATQYEREIASKVNQNFYLKAKQLPNLTITQLTQQDKKEWQRVMTKIYPQFYSTIGKDLIQGALKLRKLRN